MFSPETYANRRAQIKKMVKDGIVLIIGNEDSPMNVKDNLFRFRQDSSFLYFFGIDIPNLAGIIDLDDGKEYLFGNDLSIEDIVWTGAQKSIKERAGSINVGNTGSIKNLFEFIETAKNKKRKIHFLPPYKGESFIFIEKLLGIDCEEITKSASTELIKAIIKLRSVKEEQELKEMENTQRIPYEYHTKAMRMAKAGVNESEIHAMIQEVICRNNGFLAFPVICSKNGQTLHNNDYSNILKEGDLLLVDAGAESPMHYCTDITRVLPVGGKYSQRQKEIYEIVLRANIRAIEMAKPGVFFRDVHLTAAGIIAEGLSSLGLMKGNPSDAVAEGAHALFFPHGLGHMIGLDAHDMKALGEDFVAYNEEVSRSSQFGLSYLRMGRRLEKNFTLTIEPGIYFIPELFNLWKSEGKFAQYINYDKVEKYLDFGGVRIEDDIVVTENGGRVLGQGVPKNPADVEAAIRG